MIFNMLRVLKTNSLTIAIDDLNARLMDLRATPFEPLRIVVPASGIGRWMQQSQARRFGVSAHLKIDFAGSLIWSLAKLCLPDLPSQSPFAPPILVWRIDERLQQAAAQAAPDRDNFGALSLFLDTATAAERFLLASDLAAQFDRYLAFRMDWLNAWQKGELLGLGSSEAWQAQLWRDILGGATQLSTKHPLELFEALLNSSQFKAPSLNWPTALLVLGLEGMAPRYARIFCALSRHMAIDVVQFLPSEAYFSDTLKNRHAPINSNNSTDNLLLSRWGRCAADSLESFLRAQDGYDAHEIDRFDWPKPARSATVLNRVHSALIEAIPMSESAFADDSIQIHACHNLTRQLEVLHDVLMRLVQLNPDLKLEQILVNCPALDLVSVSLDATWGLIPSHQRLAWRVVGATSQANPVSNALLAYLKCARGPLHARNVLALADLDLVQTLWDIDADMVGVWQRWLSDAGARGGLDAAAHDSLVRALDRLVAGYAVDGLTHQGSIDNIVYPIHGAVNGEGENGIAALDKIYRVLHEMEQCAQRFNADATLAQWAAKLQHLCTEFFAKLPVGQAQALAQLRLAINQIPLNAKAAGANQTLSFDVFETALVEQLAQVAQGASPTGAITFAPAGALTHLPARVIVWLQCEDQSFPASVCTSDWDLMAKDPRASDPNPQQTARAQFLSSVVAAQDYLLIFYSGFDQRSNEPRKASVLIEDLLSFVNQSANQNGNQNTLQRTVVTNHPMHPFARASGLTHRYQALWANVADVAYGSHDRRNDHPFLTPAQRAASIQFCADGFVDDSPSKQLVAMESLLVDNRLQKNFKDFFSNASRFWLTKQLQLRNRWNQAEPPLFEEYPDINQLIKIAIANANGNSVVKPWADHPALNNAPLSAAQTAVIQSYQQDIQDVIDANPGIPIDFVAGDAKPYHKVSFWLTHWLACAASEHPVDRLLVGFGKQKDLWLPAVNPKQARDDLTDLLAIYNQQLQDGSVGLPIFINAMFAWRKDPNKRSAIEQALMGADDDDDGGGGSFKAYADMDDQFHALVWRDGPPAIEAMVPLWARIFKAMPLELAPLGKKS